MRDLEKLGRIREALSRCTFPPYTAAKRFSRQVSQMPLEQVTDAQWDYVVCLSWTYRRQMPRKLVPSEGEVAVAKASCEARKQAVAVAWAAKQKGRVRASEAPLPLMMSAGAP